MSTPSEIAFHFNVADKIPYLCRLLRKVTQAEKRVQVCGPRDFLSQLDAALWTFAADSFLAHSHLGAPEQVSKRSPIVLGEQPNAHLGSDVLVNCHAQVPGLLASFDRVIEVVGLSEEERLPARDRWRAYSAMGCRLVRHDALKPSAPVPQRARND